MAGGVEVEKLLGDGVEDVASDGESLPAWDSMSVEGLEGAFDQGGFGDPVFLGDAGGGEV